MGLRFLPFIFVLLLAGSLDVLACACGTGRNPTDDPISPEEAMAITVGNSTAVFAGKVVGFEYRDDIVIQDVERLKRMIDPRLTYKTKVVKIEVSQWWKMATGPIIYLITNEAKLSNGSDTTSDCEYPFQVGKNYVVFANGTKDRLGAGKCGPTISLKQQTETPKALGPGKKPIISLPQP